MIKAPAKFQKTASTHLKKFVPIIQTLVQKGKAGTEEDARILINDILADVLGFDKYNDLKTEYKDKNNKLDYVVKLTEGPNSRKKDKFDFVIEAKAAHEELKESYVNQALQYCATSNIDYFILTNAKEWKLFKHKKVKGKPEAHLIWEVNLSGGKDFEVLADDMFVFSKQAYTEEKWDFICDHSKATDMGDIMAVIYSDKFVKNICRALKDIHEVKVNEDIVKEILTQKIFKDYSKTNKNLLKKLNTAEIKPEEVKIAPISLEDVPPPFNSELIKKVG